MNKLVESYIAKCNVCGGMLAAQIVDPDYPGRWAKTVNNWTRWKVPPVIERGLIEEHRAVPFCKEPNGHKEPVR